MKRFDIAQAYNGGLMVESPDDGDYVLYEDAKALFAGNLGGWVDYEWQPIDTAPEDKNILVATHGGWVDTAFWTDEDGEGRKWWWLTSAKEYAKHPIHSSLMPTHWMPLPKHPTA
jgi:hypothetical protein